MGKIAHEIEFGSQESYVYGVDAYDPTKVGLGTKIIQRTGVSSEDNYVGPPNIGFARPIETGGAVPAAIPQVIPWSENIDWLFYSDQAAVAATRRVQLFTYNRTTSEMMWIGFIVVTFPFAGTQGTYLVTGFQPVYDKYVDGTASVSDTTVTGLSTTWLASGVCAGNRIGFGSSNSAEITRWYEIASVDGETTLTLTESASIGSGAYVIEDLRVAMCVTNAVTPTNGGLFLAKGLRYELFNGGGPSVPAATTVDNVRANYWLADAVTSTNTATIGCDILKTDFITQHLYVIDTTANPYMFKYNLRQSLSGLSSGRSLSAFILKTGQHGALIGAPVQQNNFCIAATYHGSGAGLPCGYFCTATRFYRTQDVTTITSGSTSWAGSSCLEIPPGGTSTHAATGTMKAAVYMPTIDRFCVATGGRMYLTRFKDDGSQWDRIFLGGTTQTLQASADNTNTTPWPSYTGGIFYMGGSGGFPGGILYLSSTGLTNITNFIYAVPVGADWDANDPSGLWPGAKQCLISPEVSTPNISSYGRVFYSSSDIIGSTSLSGHNLGSTTEGIKVSFRTSGISDDTGLWTYVGSDAKLPTIDPASSIQLRVEWKVAGNTCIPTRLYSLGLIYEDLSTDIHYQPSVGNSSIADKHFAWRFSTAFGTTVPRLKIRLYDAVAGTLLLTDDSTTQAGTWERSTDGGSNWSAWNNTDKGNDTTYLRFTPASLGDNLRVRALLTLY